VKLTDVVDSLTRLAYLDRVTGRPVRRCEDAAPVGLAHADIKRWASFPTAAATKSTVGATAPPTVTTPGPAGSVAARTRATATRTTSSMTTPGRPTPRSWADETKDTTAALSPDRAFTPPPGRKPLLRIEEQDQPTTGR
jgi:hypothetical protein